MLNFRTVSYKKINFLFMYVIMSSPVPVYSLWYQSIKYISYFYHTFPIVLFDTAYIIYYIFCMTLHSTWSKVLIIYYLTVLNHLYFMSHTHLWASLEYKNMRFAQVLIYRSFHSAIPLSSFGLISLTLILLPTISLRVVGSFSARSYSLFYQ